MKTSLLTLFIVIFLSAIPSFSLEKIQIPHGHSIHVDGTFAQDEWSDAKSLEINVDGFGTKIKIYYKHDNTNLYVAFCSHLMNGYLNCPEILLDMNNDKSAAWNPDDWWFHVSYTDCYAKGRYGDYTTCKAVQPDWEANNMDVTPFSDTIEIIIPFSTIGIVPEGIATFGICFEGTDTHVSWVYWPVSANYQKPSTWAEATIDFGESGIGDNVRLAGFTVMPNPASETIKILSGNPLDITSIEILTPEGERIFKSDYMETINISDLPQGLYLIRIKNKDFYENQKILVQR